MSTNPTAPLKLLDAENTLLDTNDGIVIRRTQEITPQFLDNLAAKRHASTSQRMGDLHHVASVPTGLVEKWMMEGFNVFDRNVKPAEIIARLKAESFQKFLATEKTAF